MVSRLGYSGHSGHTRTQWIQQEAVNTTDTVNTPRLTQRLSK